MIVIFKNTWGEGRTQSYGYIIHSFRRSGDKEPRQVCYYLGNKKKIINKYGASIGEDLLLYKIPENWKKKIWKILQKKIRDKKKEFEDDD